MISLVKSHKEVGSKEDEKGCEDGVYRVKPTGGDCSRVRSTSFLFSVLMLTVLKG
jgi:hypothetical protein